MAEFSDLAYLGKTRYGDLIKLLPEPAILQRLFPFVEAQKIATDFKEAVELEYEQGITLAGGLQAPSLVPASTAEGLQATISASQIFLRKRVGYRDIYRFRTDQDAIVFMTENENRLRQMILSHRRHNEISLLHGQSANGLGVIKTVGSTDGDGNSVLTLTDATWSAGLWAGAQGMRLAIFAPNLSTLRVAVTVSTKLDGSVPCPDIDNKTITVNGALTGVQAGDIIVRDPYYGTNGLIPSTAECAGLLAIAGTTTGNLHGIPVASHYLWRPEQYDCKSTPLKFAHIVRAAARLIPKGVTNAELMCLINELSWQDLQDELIASRNLDASYDKAKGINGVRAIEYHWQGGVIRVAVHPYMMAGDAVIFPYEENTAPGMRPLKRLGSVDFTLDQYDSSRQARASAGSDSGTIFFPIPDVAGKEMRSFSDQALFAREAGKLVRIKGITLQNAATV